MNKTLVLKGRIARILDRRTFVINLGSDHGVRTGTTFVVQGEPEEIRDPETNEVLGTLVRSKGELTVAQVMPTMSIASPKPRYKAPDFFSGWYPSFEESEIPVRKEDIKPLATGAVKVGDVVTARITIEEEKPEEEKPGEEKETGDL